MRFLKSGTLLLALSSTAYAAPIPVSNDTMVELVSASCPQAIDLRISEDQELSFKFPRNKDGDAIKTCILEAYTTLLRDGLPLSHGDAVEATRVKVENGKLILH